MKLLITVIVPSESYLRDDIKNWDKYGAGEALDDEMTLFNPSVFETPKTGLIAKSTQNGYSWNVQIIPNLNYYPVIKFYDTEQLKNVATLTGNPKEKGAVKQIIDNLMNRVGGQTGTGPISPKVKQAGLGLLAFALLLVKIKSSQS